MILKRAKEAGKRRRDNLSTFRAFCFPSTSTATFRDFFRRDRRSPFSMFSICKHTTLKENHCACEEKKIRKNWIKLACANNSNKNPSNERFKSNKKVEVKKKKCFELMRMELRFYNIFYAMLSRIGKSGLW